MIARVTRAKEGFADYLITGKRSDSKYNRNQKDKVIPLYGNLQTFKQTEKYLNKYKNYKDNYIHITLSFSQKDIDKLNEIEDDEKRNLLFKELILLYIKHHTSGYDLENEVIAYAETHLPKILTNEKNNQRFPHIHIAIVKYNSFDDTQLKTTFFRNSFMDDILQSYVCKKYGFEIPRECVKKDILDKNNLEDKIKTKIAITRANWIELLKDIKTSDELIYFLQNDLNLKENIDYKIAGSKTYKYIKILNLQQRNNKSNSLNLNGKDFQRFILKDTKNRIFPKDKSKKELEVILKSFYKRRIDEIYKRKSKKTKELLNNIKTIENEKSSTKQNSFTYETYQQKIFNKYYDYLIKDDLKGYFISKKDTEITIKSLSKNIEIVDKGNEIVSTSNSKNIEEQVSLMIEISLAKNWKLENIKPYGGDEFINEANRQIANLILENKKEKENLLYDRAMTFTQNLNKKIEDKELENQSNLDFKTLKEKLDAKLVLEYAAKNFKLDMNNYKLTSDNKIDNILNTQKRKNVIDFLQKELNLTTKESFEICKNIYKMQEKNLLIINMNKRIRRI